MTSPTSPPILAAVTAALAVVTVVGLVLDGTTAALFPAVTALLSGLNLYTDIRYPAPPRPWTVVFLLGVLSALGPTIVAGLGLVVYWVEDWR